MPWMIMENKEHEGENIKENTFIFSKPWFSGQHNDNISNSMERYHYSNKSIYTHMFNERESTYEKHFYNS